MAYTVMVVEDDLAISQMIGYGLEREGYRVIAVTNTQAARQAAAEHQPDIALIDWMLPGGSGLELIRQWRRQESTREMPMIMLTARADEDARIHGLEAGADDYIAKPFSPRELHARIGALLRRQRRFQDSATRRFDCLRMDLDTQKVYANEQQVEMSQTELKLLRFLLEHPQRIYSRQQLLDQVWGHAADVEERTVDVHILRLRKALRPANADHLLQTVRGIGYQLCV